MIKNACAKKSKHQKLIVAGDFNATTEVSLKHCCFDGKQILVDPICNDNGTRIKGFCREQRLAMTQTYFDYPLEERYTWYSENKTTKKVIDYVLVESYVQQHVKNCSVKYNLDFGSDHRLLMVELCTPSTKKARKSLKNIVPLKSLTQSHLQYRRWNNCSCRKSNLKYFIEGKVV